MKKESCPICHLNHPCRLFERFWAKVNKTPTCWLWVGSERGGGYGQFALYHTTPKFAHRVSWEMTYGPIPKGMKILHKCDIPSCVRPAHLFIGTNADNSSDMVTKNRSAYGENHGYAKLTKIQVQEIRTRYKGGNISHRKLASEYRVSRQLISAICLYRVWKSLL